ncbi:MAG: phage holin family protein [Acidiferrobacterales bacterium]|jgi:putative membrane protein|nr:phage holin family protein [Acidiferrobacterales bacterium]
MLIGILFIWLITALGLWLVTLIVPGVTVRSANGLWFAALVLGLANAFVRPVLWALTLPITVATFGLFALVVNAFMIWLTAMLVPGFEVRGFGSALLAALVMVLLGVGAFLLIEWWTVGSVHWIYMDSRNATYI